MVTSITPKLTAVEHAATRRVLEAASRGMARGLSAEGALTHAAYHCARDYRIFSRLAQADAFQGATVEDLIEQFCSAGAA